MKSKVIIWAKDKENKRVLLALSLHPETNNYETYVFPEEIVSAEFEKLLNNEWKANQDVYFPEGYTSQTYPLTATGSLLPEGFTSDQEDILNRIQAEWQFRVLSAKLSDSYKTELDIIKDKMDANEAYDASLWDDLKGTWDKIQKQIREKFLLPEHIDGLRKTTNELFDSLKVKRKEIDKVFSEKSAAVKEEFMAAMADIEEKLNKGLSFQPLFEELKEIQSRFSKAKFTNTDRKIVWNKLDNLFKDLKAKRYGKKETDGAGGSAKERLDRRYEGLLNAIRKMEQSIAYDEKELEFQHKKINVPTGQLEVQIREAKIKLTEERIASKKEKLNEILKTKSELEKKKERIDNSEKARKEKELAIKEVEKKVADDIAKAAESRAQEESTLTLAAKQISEGRHPTENKKPKADNSKPVSAETETSTNNSEPQSESTIDHSDADKMLTELKTDESDHLLAAAEEPMLLDDGTAEETQPKAEEPVIETNEPVDTDDLGLMEKVTQIVEDVVDSAKAVASVVSDKIDDIAEKVMGSEEE